MGVFGPYTFPARSQRITEDARLLTSWHPEPVSAILVLRGVGILSLHPTRSELPPLVRLREG
jgi:hypothetical protein